MKRAALILAVVSSLLLSGCGGVELYLPSYGTNEVPESFFTGQPSDASIVFPPVAKDVLRMPPSVISDSYVKHFIYN